MANMMGGRVLSVLLLLHLASIGHAALLWSCNFEQNDCGMVQDKGDDPNREQSGQSYDWIRQSGATSTANTGPSANAQGSGQGPSTYYIYMEGSDPQQTGDEARITTPNLSNTGQICVEFYYMMYGNDMGSLEVYQLASGSSTMQNRWTQSGNKGNNWLQARIDVTLSATGERIGWKGVRGTDYASDIAIDTITINSGTCAGGGGGGSGTVSLPWTCGFEPTNWCGMTQSTNDQFQWTRQAGGTPTGGTGPNGAQEGTYYAFIEANNRNINDRAIIETPDINYSGDACVKFQYHLYGSNIGKLEIYSLRRGSGSVYTSLSGNVGNSWMETQVGVSLTANDRIGFVAYVGNGIYGDIAIDKIDIQTGSCRVNLPFTCDFEKSSVCGMKQSTSDQFDWTWHQSGTPTANTGPSFASSGTYYLYAEADNRNYNDQAILETPEINYVGSVCVRFQYHMFGNTMGRLYVYSAKRGTANTWDTKQGNQGNSWKSADVLVTLQNQDKVGFIAYRGNGAESDIAIDKLSITSGSCQGARDLPYVCTFEDPNICGMVQSTGNDQFDWTRLSGSTTTPNTGPSIAKQGMYYVYTEASNPRMNGDRAILQTPPLNYNGQVCVSFSYHMYGGNLGRLELFSSTRGQGNPWKIYSGSSQNLWMDMRVDITIFKNDQVGFTGYIGNGAEGDIAIDDLMVKQGSCSGGIVLPWTCDFEGNFCNMQQRTDDNFDWTTRQGSTPTANTGPSSAQTGSSYMYMEADSRNMNDRAVIETPAISTSGPVCVTWYYHMYGNTMGQLNVYRESQGQGNPLKIISGDKGNSWIQDQVDVTVNANERIGFIAQRGYDRFSDIAIDNMNIRSGTCSGSGGTGNLPWQCTFESGLCNMVQQTNDNFDWTRYSSSTPTANTGPSSAQGGISYIYIEATNIFTNYKANIETPEITYTGPACVKFWYHMWGNQIGSLRVYTKNQGDGTPWWTLSSDQQNQWKEAKVDVTLSSNDRVGFAGVRGSGELSDIAIDSIVISNGACSSSGAQNLPWICRFETDSCNMQERADDNFNWQRQQYSTPTSQTGPNNALEGSWFLYAEADNRNPNDKALVESPPLSYSGSACLTFYYHMYGVDLGRLQIYTERQGRETSLFMTSTSQNQWIKKELNLQLTSVDRVGFYAVRGNGIYGDIAIDNILLQAGSCSGTGQKSLPWECTFEIDTCSFVQKTTDNFDWTRGSSSTQTGGTGPNNAAGGTYYMYIDADASNFLGASAVIESPQFLTTGQACVSFSYHMYGINTGKLKLGTNTNSEWWSRQGNQGNSWQSAEVTVTLNINDRIAFDASRGNGIYGDIAIDNVKVRQGTCSGGIGGQMLPWSCDFEEISLCKMLQRSDDDFNWNRQSSGTPTSGTGPGAAFSGVFYIYMEANFRAYNQKAVIETPQFSHTGQACVTFSYHMYGSDVRHLMVYTTSRGQNNPWKTFYGQSGNSWQTTKVDVNLQSSDRIGFMAVRGGGNYGDIAIDKLGVTSGSCSGGGSRQLPFVCTFEIGLCGLQQRTDDNFDWMRYSFSTPTPNTGPTSAFEGIWYLYTEADGRNPDDKAVIETPDIISTSPGPACVTFYYHMYGINVYDLGVYTQQGGQGSLYAPTPISGNKGNNWFRAQVDVQLRQTDKVGFVARQGRGSFGDIAIDSLRISSGTCASGGGSGKLPWSCDFEINFCGMTQNTQDNFDWTRQNIGTSTPNTGPFTAQQGSFFIYTEADGRYQGDRAVLESPEMSYSGDVCVKFYYHMWGQDIGTLQLYSQQRGQNSAVLTLTGNQGNQWKYQEATVNLVSNTDKVVFFTRRGNGNLGDIAIDSIKMNRGRCMGGGGATIFTCNFESSDICLMVQKTDDDFDWQRHSSKTPTDNTGPSQAQEGSFYMYIETNYNLNGARALLETPTLSQSGQACVTFYYHMYGTEIGELRVYTQSKNRDNPFFKTVGNKGTSWQMGRVTVTLQSNDRVGFYATKGTGQYGDIAIDNINIRTGDCSATGEVADVFACNFELSSICNMVQSDRDDFNWQRFSAATPTSGTGPTSARQGNYYMYLETDNYHNGARAMLDTPPLTKTGPVCVTFYYHMYGNQIGELRVYSLRQGQDKPWLVLKGNKGNMWHRGEATVTLQTNDKVGFYGMKGNGNLGDIAIDDLKIRTGDCTGGASVFACNFEGVDLCRMQQKTDDDFNWQRYSSNTPTSNTGPSSAREGTYYMYIETDNYHNGARAGLETPALSQLGQVCVHFYYHMYGSQIGQLSVYLTSKGSNAPEKVYSGNKGNSWQLARIPVTITQSNDKVVFYATKGNGNLGDIAIDDVKINRGNCMGTAATLFTCNFEASDICGMEQPTNDDFNWQRYSSGTPTANTGPSGAKEGMYYMYIETDYNLNNAKALLVTPTMTYTGDVCVTFYYHMYGSQMGELRIYTEKRGWGQSTKTYRGNKGNQWLKGQVTARLEGTDRVGFYASKGIGSLGDIAIDDISIQSGTCTGGSSATGNLPIQCDFEANFCNLIQRTDDQFNWVRISGSTETSGTGPDGAYAGSYYIYIEASRPRYLGHKAVIETPAISYSGQICVSFYYNMYGSQFEMGTLEISTEQQGSSMPARVYSGNKGQAWQYATIPLFLNSVGDKIRFTGVVGNGFRGDVAMDNVDIRAGSCTSGNITTTEEPATTMTPATTVAPTGGAGSLPWTCNFESDLCSMRQRTDDNFDWTRYDRSTPSSSTGPSGAQSGRFFLYTEANNRFQNDRAMIETPVIAYQGMVCVKFYYHMYGSNMGELHLYTDQGGFSNHKWKLAGFQPNGNQWKEARVPVDLKTNDRVGFMALRGNGEFSDIGLDSISIDRGDCGSGVGTTLPWNCNFDAGTCNMNQRTDDNFDWTRYSSSTPTSFTGPTGAHSGGFYMYIEANGKMSNTYAMLETPLISYTGQVCLTFYYHMYGNDVNMLQLYTQNGGSGNSIWSRSGNQGNDWRLGQVSLSLSGTDKIGFKATRGFGDLGDIAIDSISIQQGACSGSGTVNLPWYCNFDQTTCSIQQLTNDNFDWTRYNSPTPTFNTGPDRAQSGAYYMYIEADNRNPGDKAVFESPTIAYRGTACVTFYYHMDGVNIGTLQMYTKQTGEGNPYFTQAGSTSRQWIRGQRTVQLQGSDAVGFLGRRGNGIYGDIAVDSISVTQGTCSGAGVRSLPFSCSFETSTLCNMQQRTDDQFDWQQQQGRTPSDGTGPERAQLGNSYIYTEASSPRRPGDRAIIETPSFSNNGRVCVTFYYHMYGMNMGELRIYTQNRGQGSPWKTIVGNKGNSWVREQFSVELTGNNDKVAFLGIRGREIESDISIDNLLIQQGECSGPQSLPFRCSFENSDICRMKQSSLGLNQFDWKRQTGGTPTESTGPNSARDGSWYMYIEVSENNRQPGDQAILETPPLSYSGQICLKYYYHMYGVNIGELRIVNMRNVNSNPYRTLAGQKQNQWLQDSVTVNIQERDRIGFMGVRGNGWYGDIAIDHIEINQGPCSGGGTGQVSQSCNFESNLCRFRQAMDDQFDWTRRSGNTETESTGPNSAQSGMYYVYIETSSPRTQGQRAILETGNMEFSGQACLSFFYHMYGSNIGRLIVYRSSRGESNPILNEMGNRGNSWLPVRRDIEVSQGETIRFLGEVGNGIQGDIALDEINVYRGSCQGAKPTTPKPTTGPIIGNYFSCDFERDGRNDACHVIQDTGDMFDWQRASGATNSGTKYTRMVDGRRIPVTGPENAQQGSFYLFAEASNRRAADKARVYLAGNVMQRSGINCLRFAYMLNGFHVGALYVYTIRRSGQKLIPWEMHGDQHLSWRKAAVQIDLSDITRVGFEVRMTGQFSGDIAIDNIQFNSGQCQKYVWWCNFEMSDGSATMCNMRQDTTDTSGFDWTLWRGPTPSVQTGPDRAFNGEYYLYFEASTPRLKGDNARIFLPRQQRSGDHCIEFRYHMYGFHIKTLELFTSQVGSMSYNRKWSKEKQIDKNWHDARVTLENLNPSDEIGFNGIRGTEFSGDIALDNIRLKRGRC